MKTIIHVLNHILRVVLAVLTGAMVLVCCWQVITRFILNSPSKYTEEILRYALIWLTMLGAPYAYGANKQLSIDLLVVNFTHKGQTMTKIFGEIVVTFLSAAVFVYGGIAVTLNASGQISAAMKLPMEFYYACIPIGGALMILYSVDRLITDIHELKEEK
jgi:TRAP-type C4-dicarboxylate transport system permease small subunit